MSDMGVGGAATGQVLDLESLVRRIEAAPAKVWARLRNSLGVKDRPAAVNLVQQSPQAAKVADNILAGVVEEAEVPPLATSEGARPATTSKRARLKIEG